MKLVQNINSIICAQTEKMWHGWITDVFNKETKPSVPYIYKELKGLKKMFDSDRKGFPV